MIKYGFTVRPHVLLPQFLHEHGQALNAQAVLSAGVEEPKSHQVEDSPKLIKHQMMSKLKRQGQV
jgi:hypothetical protein